MYASAHACIPVNIKSVLQPKPAGEFERRLISVHFLREVRTVHSPIEPNLRALVQNDQMRSAPTDMGGGCKRHPNSHMLLRSEFLRLMPLPSSNQRSLEPLCANQ
ncbi:hypothetical protein LIA77_03526 [Sarocladium implicatum]|nr:hypothetical protein LIA77_03526 [Sarocladium implicatum]